MSLSFVRAAIKDGLLASGHYRRCLARLRFPGVATLGYHGLRADRLPSGSMAFENLHVRESVFDAHCRLIRETCHPISLDDWRRAAAGQSALPARPVLITFDDGYRSVLTIAAPVLAKYNLPAVVFVCSDPVERRRLIWFDDVAARSGEAAVELWKQALYDSWRAACVEAAGHVEDDDPRAPMTPSDLGTLATMPGVEIGAHTARHAILRQATRAQQHEEIVESQNAIARWTGRAVRAFAYPNGRPMIDYSEETVEIVRSLGFDVGFTTRPSFSVPAEPSFERSRFLILASVSAAELAHRLAFSWPR